MTPSSVVSDATRDLKAKSQQGSLIAPVYGPDVAMPGPFTRADTTVLELPKDGPGHVQSAAEFAQVRNENTKQISRSNYWAEVANILRWCTTGMIGLSGLATVNAAGSVWGSTAVSALTLPQVGAGLALAFSSGAVWAAVAGLAVLAVATIQVSQFSRKLLAEKTFDVQETFVQRQAGLIGQSVEQALAPEGKPERPVQSWAERTGQAALDRAESPHAAR